MLTGAGEFNHLVMVSTKQVNAGDSGANNIGFRCAESLGGSPKKGKGGGVQANPTDEGSDRIEL